LTALCIAAICLPIAVLGAAERPRLAVLTDIGGDPDDQQSMIRLMPELDPPGPYALSSYPRDRAQSSAKD
jgi:hypothetical protein